MAGLLQRLRVMPTFIKVTYGATRFFNALRSLFPRSGRRGLPRRGAESVSGAEPINGQGLEPYASIPFGRYSVSRSGCAVIAAYNALYLLGDPIPFSRALAWFERRGSMLGAALGVHPLAVRKLLERRGHSCEAVFPARAGDLSALDAAFACAKAAVLTFWNGPALRDRDGAWTGAHTVAVGHTEKGAAIYNARNGVPAPLICGSLTEYIRREGVQPMVLLLIYS